MELDNGVEWSGKKVEGNALARVYNPCPSQAEVLKPYSNLSGTQRISHLALLEIVEICPVVRQEEFGDLIEPLR